jgi:uncharacterized membrane protein YhaH (DUF805 family)
MGRVLRFIFTFEGRATRAQFWLTPPALILTFFCGVVALAKLNGAIASSLLSLILALAAVALVLAIWWACIAISVKRLHDRDKPGQWLLIFWGMPTLLGWVVENVDLNVLERMLLSLSGTGLSIWGLVEMGFLRGVPRLNAYGDDPLAG